MSFTRIVLILLSFFSVNVFAADPTLRLGGGLGMSGGNYSESYGSAKANVTLSKSLALHGQLGIDYLGFYAAYAPVYRLSGDFAFNDHKPTGARYFSPLAFEFGWNAMGLGVPAEVFFGVEYGRLKFTQGTESVLTGIGYKIGADILPFHLDESHHIGFRFEYKNHSMQLEDFNIPGFNTSLSTYYIGVIFLFSPI